jgi:ATP-dependent DNA ligase
LPMLALPAAPFDSAAHLFEIKWDGVRALAAVEPSRWALWGRRGVDYTARYPELAVLGRLPAGTVIDGELVVLRQGRADLPALLSRHLRCRPLRIGESALPVGYVVFDLLYDRGQALFQETLVQRRARLRALLDAVREPLVMYSEGVVGTGREFFAQVVAQGHEGMMAKQVDSGYRPGKRSPAWRKIKPRALVPCLIVGYQAGRDGIERLLLATLQAGVLRYVGRVRVGRGRSDLAQRLPVGRRPQPVVPCPRPACWVEPELYCRVAFQGWTAQGRLRHPVFAGWLP